MVETRDAIDVLGRGFLGGVGLRSSRFVGEMVGGDQADLAGGVGNIVAGGGVDLGGKFVADEMLSGDVAKFLRVGTEWFGTGIQVAGWDEIGEALGITAGVSSVRVVELEQETAFNGGVEQEQVEEPVEHRQEEFRADVG